MALKVFEKFIFLFFYWKVCRNSVDKHAHTRETHTVDMQTHSVYVDTDASNIVEPC